MIDFFVKYNRQVFSKETVILKQGFFTHKEQLIDGKKHLYLPDIFIDEDFRNDPDVAKFFISEMLLVAKSKKCDFIIGSLSYENEGQERSCVAQLKNGFKFFRGNDRVIFLRKSVE